MESTFRVIEAVTDGIFLLWMVYEVKAKKESMTDHVKTNYKLSQLTAICAVANILFAIIKIMNGMETEGYLFNLIGAIGLIVVTICFASLNVSYAKFLDLYIDYMNRDAEKTS